jgi:hypothetical protein
MQTEEMNLNQADETPGEATPPWTALTALGENVGTDEWVANEPLNDTCVSRNPLQERESRKDLAVNALAAGRRTVRLLWIALIVR